MKAGKTSGARKGARGTARPALRDWRGEVLDRVRKLIEQADPEVVEEVKWRKPSNGMAGVPVWSHGGIICTGEMYTSAVKLTFAKGASLEDPSGLFNASLEGGTRRAIDIREGDRLDERAFKALIRAAVELNTAGPAGAAPVSSPTAGRGAHEVQKEGVGDRAGAVAGDSGRARRSFGVLLASRRAGGWVRRGGCCRFEFRLGSGPFVGGRMDVTRPRISVFPVPVLPGMTAWNG